MFLCVGIMTHMRCWQRMSFMMYGWRQEAVSTFMMRS